MTGQKRIGKQTIVIDIDDTLIIYPDNTLEGAARYPFASPNVLEIDLCNKLFDQGHTIILHTGRNWNQYDLTVNQMDEIGIKYHELVMGKPQGIYIDKDSYQSLLEVDFD